MSGRITWKYFVVLRRRSLSQFSEKMQKLKVIFEGKCLTVLGDSIRCMGFQYNIACQ